MLMRESNGNISAKLLYHRFVGGAQHLHKIEHFSDSGAVSNFATHLVSKSGTFLCFRQLTSLLIDNHRATSSLTHLLVISTAIQL